nr:hypothetical protein [Pseudomonas sp. GM74]
MTGLSVAAHSFTATALYGSGQVSTARTLTVTANTAPTITSVKDQSDWVIPDNGYTVHTSVTLTGSAPAGQEVEVFLGTTSKGKAKAGTDSIWTHTLSGLTLNVLHTIKAVGQYANNPPSNLWRLTALNEVVPAITAAHDSKGQPIANGGSTIDTTVRLTGTANTFLEVEIFDGTASTGKKAKANDQRVWTVDLTGLTIDDHSFKAKALYGSGTESAPRTLTVAADTAPTITSAKGSPSGVEIREGAPTLETAVILTGTANKGQQVEVFNNNVSKGTPTADATTGIWTLPVSGLSVTAHSFTAKALYGSGQTSAPRTFRVVNERLLDNFDSYPEQFTGLGNPLRLPTMTITSSTTYIGITPFNSASGIMERQVLFIHNSTIARITLKSEYSHVKFSMLCYSKTILTFYNSNGTCLGEHRPPHGDGASFPPPNWVEFNAPGGHKISYIEVDQTAGGTQVGYIDYFYIAS